MFINIDSLMLMVWSYNNNYYYYYFLLKLVDLLLDHLCFNEVHCNRDSNVLIPQHLYHAYDF